MAAIAHRFKRHIDLAERGLGHGYVPLPLGNEHQCDAFIAESSNPVGRCALPSSLFQRFPKGGEGLF